MRSLFAFLKKEWMEQVRSGKLVILGIIFILFGIMNPAIAKLTPWMMEMFADSLAESGMIITEVEVDAMTSWVQFFKNIPMGLIVFVLMEGSIFTKEYQTGTLILALTKGLKRRNVVFAKTTVLFVLWSAFYWLCYGITYGYNAYFWDNAVAKNLGFSAICWWMFGLMVMAVMVLFSTIASNSSGVLLGTGAAVMVPYFISLLPKLARYFPSMLMDGNSLIYAVKEPKDYMTAMVITVVVTMVAIVMSVPLLNKKKI